MPIWEQAAGAVVGTGMGLALQGINNKQQLKQQQKLTDQQVAAQKQMGIFNREQQMKLWEDTNFSAQKAQMKKAGLSPGLMYGGGPGAGGTTAAASGSVGAPQATKGNEPLGMGLMGGQAALMQAQIKAIEAQKRNTDADTANKLAEHPNIPTTGENIKADTALKGAQKSLIETQQGIASIEEAIKGATQNAQIATIMQGTEASMEGLRMLRNSRHIQDETVQTQIKQYKADLANTILDNYLKQAETKNIDQDTKNKIQQIQNMVQDNMRQWDKLSLEQQRLTLDSIEINRDKTWDDVKSVLDNILIIPGLGGGKAPTTIRGLHKRD